MEAMTEEFEELKIANKKLTGQIELLELKDESDRNDIIILYEEAIEKVKQEVLDAVNVSEYKCLIEISEQRKSTTHQIGLMRQ